MTLGHSLMDSSGEHHRTCIVTHQGRREEELIRFVRAPAGNVVPDVGRKLPGRGVWVSLNRDLVSRAVEKNLLLQGFGEESTVDPDLANVVGRLLRAAALSYLSLAKKAGEAVTGFMKVDDLLATGRVAVLLHAREARPDGCRKLDRMVGLETFRTSVFGRDELDLAFGGANVVHAAVAKGGLSEKLLAALRRIEVYEGPLPGPGY
jgi:predicted RNA-binding protein YlxR (DUF448 family)